MKSLILQNNILDETDEDLAAEFKRLYEDKTKNRLDLFCILTAMLYHGGLFENDDMSLIKSTIAYVTKYDKIRLNDLIEKLNDPDKIEL